jgi:hypothetical protein
MLALVRLEKIDKLVLKSLVSAEVNSVLRFILLEVTLSDKRVNRFFVQMALIYRIAARKVLPANVFITPARFVIDYSL